MRTSPTHDRVHRAGPRTAGAPIVFLLGYVVLLLALPARLIVGPLGAPGTPANLWGIAALVWWCGTTLAGLNPVKGLTPVRVAAGVLVAAVLAAYANGMASGWYAPADVREATSDIFSLAPASVGEVAAAMTRSADRGLLSLAGWAGIMLLTADGLRSWSEVDRLVTWLTWAAGLVAVLGVVQFFTSFDLAALFTIPGLQPHTEFGAVDTRSVLNRPASTAGHPIEFGVVLGCLLPLTVHHALHRRGSLLVWLPALLVFLGCAMSVSRSAVLVAGTAFLVLLVGWPPLWRRRALVLAPVAVICLRVLVPGLVGTVVALFTNLLNDTSISGRTGDYGTVLRVYADHPLLGRGLFTFIPRYYRILDNQYLVLLLELGLVGLLAGLLVYAAGFGSARTAFRIATSARDRNLGLTLSASITGLAVSLVTFDAWSYAMATGCTFLLVGLAGAAWRLAREDRTARVAAAAAVASGPRDARPEART